MTYEEHLEHFRNWYVNHKNFSKWEKQLDANILDYEDITLIYAKETNVIAIDRVDYWVWEFGDIMDEIKFGIKFG